MFKTDFLVIGIFINNIYYKRVMDYQEKESNAVAAIKKAIPQKLKKDMHPLSEGKFAELFQNDEVFPKHYLACAIDGVGTKLILAEAMNVYDTVGVDLVAMSANDLATLGKVSPFLFIDYFAVQSKLQEKGLTGDLMKGIVKGLEACDAGDILRSSIHINIGKGETASVDELISSAKPGYGFDIAGGMIGFIKKSDVPAAISVEDKIVALRSSGPHSNGYTDLRLNLLKGEFETRKEFKGMYKGKHKLDEKFDGSTIGKRLLEPTAIYTKAVAAIANKVKMIGVNNTGYGLKNLNRVKGFRFIIDNPLEPQPIFGLMQEDSNFSEKEMYQKFNMGMGFFIITPDADTAISIAEKYGCEAKTVGKVSNGSGTVLKKGRNDILFEGY